MRQKIILWIAVFLLLSSYAYAIGIAPGNVNVIFEPNLRKTIPLKIVNEGGEPLNAVLYAEGELADYVSFPEVQLTFRQGETEKQTSFQLNLPASLAEQGDHLSDISVRAFSPNSGGTITTNIVVKSKLKVTVPYSGKFVEARLILPQFRQNQQSNFAVEMQNLGTEDIEEAQAFIDILGLGNTVLETLQSQKLPLAAKDKKLVTVPYTASQLSGLYTARLTVVYDGKTTVQEKQFSIGDLDISIDSVSVDKFQLGGIAQFDILVSNLYNLPITGIFAEVKVKDSGKTYTTFKTATADLDPHSKQILKAFWDTDKVVPGQYLLNVVVFYAGKAKERQFDIIVSPNSISATPTGKVVQAGEAQQAGLLSKVNLLIALVLVLVVFNIVIIFMRFRPKNSS